MRPHDGILILALLVLAVAGCRKDESSEPSSRGRGLAQTSGRALNGESPPPQAGGALADPTPTEQPVSPPVGDDAAVDQTLSDDGARVTPAESVESLHEARRELDNLADGAVSLREALLGARFRDPNASGSRQKGQSHERR